MSIIHKGFGEVVIFFVHFVQSCSKAWEYRGFVSEKEQAYRDAAVFYEKAWKYSCCAYPTIGMHNVSTAWSSLLYSTSLVL